MQSIGCRCSGGSRFFYLSAKKINHQPANPCMQINVETNETSRQAGRKASGF
jgi:hypothetical protein